MLSSQFKNLFKINHTGNDLHLKKNFVKDGLFHCMFYTNHYMLLPKFKMNQNQTELVKASQN